MQDDIPLHHFHLGGDNFIFVSDFSGTLKVHIRKFRKNEYGHLAPTKMGITLSPVLWGSLAKDLNLLSIRHMCERPEIVKDSLMMSMVHIDNTPYITIQRYFQRNDFIRVFLPSICLLSETEWETLKDIHIYVTIEIIMILFNSIFPKMIMKEVTMQSPSTTSDIKNCEVEIVLTSSLMDLLKNHLEGNIEKLFMCTGCAAGYANQLDHKCITSNFYQRLHCYGDLAIFSMNLELLANEFVQQNAQIANYITDEFLSKLDMYNLLQNTKELYVASDQNPTRMH